MKRPKPVVGIIVRTLETADLLRRIMPDVRVLTPGAAPTGMMFDYLLVATQLPGDERTAKWLDQLVMTRVAGGGRLIAL